MKKWIALFLALVMGLGLMACAAEPDPILAPDPAPMPVQEPEPAPEESLSNLVGISLPTKDLQRWNQDGANMQSQLEAAGYKVDLQYAENDVSLQISQIEKMIGDGAKVLVISAIDGEALGAVLAQAKETGVAVISYDRFIWGSDAVSYYITFDNYLVGVKQGQYIVDRLDLSNVPEGTSYNIEFVSGESDDWDKWRFIWEGAKSILQPYLDSGVLVCQSGQTEMLAFLTEASDAAKAQERFENILSTYYTDKPLHAILSTCDSTAQGAAAALESTALEGLYSNEVYPIITGLDCDLASVKNILEGKQAMSVFKDPRDLAAKAAEMVDAIMKGSKPTINDTETYDNGTGIIPSYLCEPRVCTIDNYKELLIDSGYYTEDQLVW